MAKLKLRHQRTGGFCRSKPPAQVGKISTKVDKPFTKVNKVSAKVDKTFTKVN